MSWRNINRYGVFRDRRDAGRQLAAHLVEQRPAGEIVVLALPRGGVPVGYEIARALEAPLDVLVVRKLGAPFNPELAIGAIGPQGVVVLNESVIAMLHISKDALEAVRAREQAVLEQRERAYRRAGQPIDVAGKTAIVVDDGIATGATMLAAVRTLKALGPRQIIVAVPTSSVEAHAALLRLGVDVIALHTPEPYIAVGAWYEHFDQTSDADVVALLEECTAAGSGSSGGTERHR